MKIKTMTKLQELNAQIKKKESEIRILIEELEENVKELEKRNQEQETEDILESEINEDDYQFTEKGFEPSSIFKDILNKIFN